MSVITANEVARQFNAAIMDLMNKGYVISPFTWNGSYSKTKTHIDLVKPNDSSHILRVWMIEETMSVGKLWWQSIDVVGPRVKKYTSINGYDGKVSKGLSLWPNDGEVIYEKLFYKFKEDNGNKIFSDDLDEATRLVNMRFERQMNIPVGNPFNYRRIAKKDKLTTDFVDSIMRRINSIRGFKRATASCIDTVELYKYDSKLKATVRYNFNGKSGIISLKQD